MANKLFLFAFAALILVSSLGFVSATATVINSVTINDTDNFYSNYTGNNIVHIIVNVSGVGTTGYVYANFSALGNIDCGSSTGNQIALSNDTYGGDIYNGSCNVGDEAALSNFNMAGPVAVIAKSSPGFPPDTQSNSATIILYNMTTPQMPPGCQRFGPKTTNFATQVSDFSRVNFVINIQNNFTCMVQQLNQSGPTLSEDYLDVMILNLTSVNLSTQDQFSLLAQLPSMMTLSISQPKVFPSITKIWVNGTGFAALNTNASIQLLNLPFISKPNVSSDNLSELLSTSWVTNGFDSGFQIVTGNLTINVLGFTTYNSSDTANPLVTINSPALNSSAAITAFNVTVNGTGTEPSSISIAVDVINSYVYNSTTNTANCTSISATNETFQCYRTIPTLSDGSHSIAVTALDYGGTTGNTNITSKSFIVDTTKPTLTITNPINGTTFNANESIQLYVTATDTGVGVNKLWYNWNGTTNVTGTNPLNVNVNYTTTGLKTIFFYANDSLNNVVTSTVQVNITGALNSTTSVIANSSSLNVSSSTTTIIVGFNSSIQTVTLTNTTQQVSFDLHELKNSSGAVTVGTNNFTLTTIGTSNYTAFIPALDVITGGAGWDGKINLPTINSSSFTISSVTADIVIDMGTSSGITFSSPVEIIIGGMAGKHAAWSLGTTGLTDISTQCSDTSGTGIPAGGECYIDASNGVDLIIWTYHFTSFAAYTPAQSSTGGGHHATTTANATCTEAWSCSGWSTCTGGTQTQVCIDSNNCGTTANKPAEMQACVSAQTPEVKVNQTTGIIETGKQVVKEVTQTAKQTLNSWIFWGSIAVIVIAGIIYFSIPRKKK